MKMTNRKIDNYLKQIWKKAKLNWRQEIGKFIRLHWCSATIPLSNGHSRLLRTLSFLDSMLDSQHSIMETGRRIILENLRQQKVSNFAGSTSSGLAKCRSSTANEFQNLWVSVSISWIQARTVGFTEGQLKSMGRPVSNCQTKTAQHSQDQDRP